jgi:hypothetical protein
VRQALSPAELPALTFRKLRGKGSNLDRHVQSVVSCRLDDPEKACLSVHLPIGKIDAAGGCHVVGHGRVP